MSLRATFMSVLAFLSIALIPSHVTAETVKLDFESLAPGGSVFGNLNYKGLRISPSCHFDVISLPYLDSGGSGIGIGFDSAGCPPPNVAYIGPISMQVAIDNYGKLFDLVSFDHAVGMGSLISSKGGVVAWGIDADLWSTEFLTSDLWRGVSWVAFTGESPGTPIALFDNFVVQIPVSSSLSLVVLGVALLARLRKRNSASAALPSRRGDQQPAREPVLVKV